MSNQIINTRLCAIRFALERNFILVKMRANTLFYLCGQVEFEVNDNWCAYYIAGRKRKMERLIWSCRW